MIDLIKKLDDILPDGDRWKVAILLAMMFVMAGLEVLGISVILAFITIVANPEQISEVPFIASMLEYMEIETQRDLLIYGSIALIVVFLVKNVFLVTLHYFQNLFTYNRFRIISEQLFILYMNAPYTFHLQRNTAQLIRNITHETRFVATNVIKPLLETIMESILIIGIVIFLLTIEPIITLVALGILGGTSWGFLKIVKQRTQLYGRKSSKSREKVIQEVNEGIGGFKDATLTNRQGWFVRRFHASAKILAKSEIFKNISRQSSDRIIEFTTVVGMLLIAIVLLWQGRDVSSVIPILTLFGASAIRLMPSLSKITGNYNTLRYYTYAISPIHADLMTLGYQMQKNNHKIKTQKMTLKNAIELEKVSYQYPRSHECVLNNVSLTIKRGTAVGFVGPSGAGKTTIVDIILGLLDPIEGTVRVDGVDIQDSIKGWQANIGYIPQGIYLSDDTIRNNIAFGLSAKQIDEDQLQNAVRMAQLEGFVKKLPEGLDTVVGEGGVRLSGGQRQRIGIARALYNNPEVLVMDEATSSLDNRTERYIIEEIERLKGDRTIIVIAHRLTTVKNCDVLYVMKDGKIVASGSYNGLVNSSDDFRSIVDEN